MITRYSAHGLIWVDLLSPTTEEILLLTEDFDIPSRAIEEMNNPSLRSKVDLYHSFLYLILHFPQVHPNAVLDSDQEIDFLVGKDFLITIHYDENSAISEFAKVFEKNSILSTPNIESHGGIIFMQLAKILYAKSLMQLEEMTTIIKQIENRIFSNQQNSIVKEISTIARKLLDIKQSLRFHQEVLDSYDLTSQKFFGENYRFFAQRIISDFRKVYNVLESHREVLAELQRTNDSLLSTKSNEIMKNFTILTFVMLPLSLITGIFGMNTVSNLVFIKSISDFYFILGVMVITGIVMFLFFKHRRWI